MANSPENSDHDSDGEQGWGRQQAPERSRSASREESHRGRSRSRSSPSRSRSPQRSTGQRRPTRQSRSYSPRRRHETDRRYRRSRSRSRGSPESPRLASTSRNRLGRRLEPASWYLKKPSEHVDSSWIEEPGQHGHRRKRNDSNGKEVIWRTAIEDLKTRKAKYKYIRANGHWFGRLHRISFNPYTQDQDLKKKPGLKIFARPFVQAGRGSNNLQHALGLKDDRDYFNDIRGSYRDFCSQVLSLTTLQT